MSGWQPIETAPRDGSVFLAGRFVGPTQHKPHRFRSVDRWHSRERGDAYDGLGHFNERFWPATHWMPLPPDPTPSHDLTPEDIRTCSQAELEARGLA